MTDLPTVIHERFRRALAAALPDAPEAADADPVIRPSTNARFGDYQANAAMALAKRLGHKPRDLAQRIIDHLDSADLFENVEIAGPGFINLTLTAAAIEQHVHAMHQDQRLGVPHVESPRTVVVDYSGPNVAKEMHIGHLRSTIIGDAIARVLDFQGHDVKRRNHLGDWGTQFGMLIEHLSETFPREQLVTEDISIGDLNAFYQAAKVKFDADPAFAKRSRARVVKLQGGDADSVQLWQALRKESIEHFDTTYQRLDVLLAD